MKNANPHKFALLNASYLTLFAGVIFALFQFVFFQFSILPFISYLLLIFGFTYSLVFTTSDRFIYEKVKIIYKNINNLKGTRKSFWEKHKNEPDILESVNRDVMQWATDKSSEIESLKKLEAYRREYIGNVSHELKTPIFNIQGYILTLLDGGLEDTSINKEYLLRTESSINRMIAIVQDLEAISQLESGELKLDYTRFDILALCREIVEFLEIKAKKRKVKLIIAPNENRVVMVYADKKRIRQVLTNLIDNSIKYGKETDNSYTKVSFYDMDENFLIEVADNGIGVAETDLHRIFERFFRTDKARSRSDGGTGLGLSIVKHIIEAHDQKITVRSTLGFGTTFGFTLKKA
jgi:two-component system, OmpR family, phosphate regulon sensor histidine kinase PhoR